jgi:hypothetical protein
MSGGQTLQASWGVGGSKGIPKSATEWKSLKSWSDLKLRDAEKKVIA